MKKVNANIKEWLIGVIFSLAMFLFFLITGFEIGAYGSWDFYQKEYEKYAVADELYMEMEDIMDVTKYMMSYLRGNEDELTIVTMVEGREQDFFNEQDRFHMGEVRDLFLGGLMLRRIAVITILICAFVLYKMKSNWKEFLPQIYRRTLAVLALLIGGLGLAIAQNFNKVFVIFHKIFFDNDLWIFDPATDYMIRMLPEGFFFDIVIRIGGTFILLLAVSLTGSVIISKTYKKNEIY